MPVAQNSNYVSVSFFTAGSGADSLMKLLGPLKKQLVWLNLNNAAISDAAVDEITKLTVLTRLQLSNTGITDKGLTKLQSLQELQSLNLVGTKVTATGVSQLKGLKKLKNLYLYQTGAKTMSGQCCKRHFREHNWIRGKYTVPTFATDTTVVKYN